MPIIRRAWEPYKQKQAYLPSLYWRLSIRGYDLKDSGLGHDDSCRLDLPKSTPSMAHSTSPCRLMPGSAHCRRRGTEGAGCEYRVHIC